MITTSVGERMNDAAWWARVVRARTERDDLLPKRVWVLRKDGREAAIDVKAVPGIGAEIVLTVDGVNGLCELVSSRCMGPFAL
jgi:hypothetical protein